MENDQEPLAQFSLVSPPWVLGNPMVVAPPGKVSRRVEAVAERCSTGGGLAGAPVATCADAVARACGAALRLA